MQLISSLADLKFSPLNSNDPKTTYAVSRKMESHAGTKTDSSPVLDFAAAPTPP